MKQLRWVVPALCLLFLVVYIIWAKPAWFFENGPALLGWVAFILSVAYQRFDAVYWKVQKWVYAVRNPDTQWDLTVTYQGSKIDLSVLDTVREALCQAAELDRPTVRIISEQRFELRADELFLEVSVAGLGDVGSLDIMVSKLPVSFRRATYTIENRLAPILEAVEQGISVKEKRYWLTAYFGKVNPYFGLYLRRLRPESVKEVHVKVVNNNGEALTIAREKITIFACSLGELSKDARKFLTLSEMPA